jgi:periplasmic iron binding protein
MRSLWVFCALLLAVFPALIPWGVEAAVIGGPLLRDGIEIVPSTQTGVELDRPVAMSRAADSVFLIADVHAGKDEAHGFAEHAFIPYLAISYVLTKDDTPAFKKVGLLYPVTDKGGPHYAASAEMAGPGTYHLTYIISPPSAHGMLRRTDKAGGVPDWFKPITGNWVFTYSASAK